jgi:predicted  nucleic acid-binding Zn-ribbon protein
MTSCLTTEAVETMAWSQTTESVEVIVADYVVDVMQIITALRKKHHPQVDCRASHMSTVGLVVEGGSHISAVVPGGTCAQTHFVCPTPCLCTHFIPPAGPPGPPTHSRTRTRTGPCDRDFGGERISTGDEIVLVDGTKYGPAQLLEALVGDDIVGSQVRLNIRKHHSTRTFDCVVQRGALARIQAVGQLFLMLSKLIADIETDNRVLSVADILQVETQARVVETTTNIFLNCFKSHVHDLESALFDVLQTSTKMIAHRTSALHRVSTEKAKEAQRLAVDLQEAEVRLRAALQRESRRERTDKALQDQVDALKIELQGSQELSRELEAQLKASKNRSGETQRGVLQLSNKLAAVEGHLSLAQKGCHDVTVERDCLRAELERLHAELRDVESGSAAKANQLTQEIGVLQQGREKAEGERDALDAEVKALKAQLSDLTSDSDTKVNELMRVAEKLKQEIETLQQHLLALGQGLEKAEGERDALDAEVKALKAQLSDLTSDSDAKVNELMRVAEKLKQEIETLQQHLLACVQGREKAEGERDALDAEVKALKAQLSDLTSDSDAKVNELMRVAEKLKQEIETLQQHLRACVQGREKAEGERDALDAEVKALKAQLSDLTSDSDAKVNELMREVEMLQQKLASTANELTQRLEGSFVAFKKQCDALKTELTASVSARERASQESDRLHALVAGMLTHTCTLLRRRPVRRQGGLILAPAAQVALAAGSFETKCRLFQSAETNCPGSVLHETSVCPKLLSSSFALRSSCNNMTVR